MFIYKHKSNKLYVFLVFIFLLLIGGLYKIKATSLPLFGRTFYIDAGHGGRDTGAIYQDIQEKQPADRRSTFHFPFFTSHLMQR